MSSYSLNPEGYLVLEAVLTPEECQQVSLDIYRRIVDTTFTARGFAVDPADKATVELLTDPARRRAVFGERADQAIFRDGSSRSPLVSKSTGMTSQHYIPSVLEKVAFNPTLFQAAASLYGTSELAFSAGLEKVCFKAPGATAMPAHIDWCPFSLRGAEKEVNYPVRFQCLVTTSIDTAAPAAKSGTLCLLTNFHHYVDFFGRLCAPRSGLVPFPAETSLTRFFVLPKNFNSHYLPQLRLYANLYADFQQGSGLPLGASHLEPVFTLWLQSGLRLPLPLPPLEWTPIALRPGQAVFWDQRLPHYSLANKSAKVRVCCYYSIFPKTNFSLPQEQVMPWLRQQVLEYRLSYYRDADRLTETISNPEEMQWLRDHPEEAERVRRALRATSWRRSLVGLTEDD